MGDYKFKKVELHQACGVEQHGSDMSFFAMGQGSCNRSHAGKLSRQRLVTRSLDSIPGEQGDNKRSKATLDVGSTARLAQSVVGKALNLVVVGSSPTVGD